MLAKIDSVEKELATFKIRVFALSSVFGSIAGIGAGKLAKLLGLI